jgi:demethylmenaquinone methyltransferase/2-methoxy-6-polyprenyl-1,4-benzoquinol methylase
MPFDHFNLIAGLYDRAAQFTVTEPLIGLLSLSPNSVLLDAGGGTGRIAAALRNMVREAVVVDLSRGMLRRAADKGLEAVRAPAERLPFPSGTFDRVIMLDALHHVLDQGQTAGELWRVLSPGGRLLIVEPDINQFAVKLIAFMEKILLMRSHFLAGEKIAAFFENRDVQARVVYSDHNVIVLIEKAR